MFSVAFVAFLLGIAATITVQELVRANRNYKDRKQAEFEAAVKAEAEYRLNRQSNHGYGNVRSIPPDPYAFDEDPFGMLK